MFVAGLSLRVLAQRATDTFRLYFDLNVSALNTNSENNIDLLIYNDKIISGSTVMIIGYADYLGSEGYNKNLSMKRAEKVRDYLVKYGVNPADIKLCLGQGKVERDGLVSKDGYPTDRRVDIVVNNRGKKKKHPDQQKTSGTRKDTIARKTAVKSLDEINQLKVGAVYQLHNVYFPPDRHVIQPESYATLERLYVVLRDNPGMKISIEGHVCCISSEAPDAYDIDTHEPTLSINRAHAIYNYLIDKGINESRLKYAGFGKKHPVVIEEITEEEKEMNRRVEIRIIGN